MERVGVAPPRSPTLDPPLVKVVALVVEIAPVEVQVQGVAATKMDIAMTPPQ